MPPRYFIGIERQPEYMTPFFTPLAPSRNFYISAAGNDSNAGTSQGASWKTIAKVNANFMEPGDQYNFNGGDTFNDATLTPNVSGTVASPITFTSYGTGQATISRTAADGISFTNLSNLVISNLTVTGSSGTSSRGIHPTYTTGSSSNLIISGCNVSGFSGEGIMVDARSGGFISNVAITNCVTDGCVTASQPTHSGGIVCQGVLGADLSGVYQISNLQISNCVARNNVQSGTGIFVQQVNGGIASGCVTHHNGTVGNGGVGMWMQDSKNVIYQYCESYAQGNVNTDNDGAGFDMDGGCNGCIIEYCYSHDNKGAGLMLFSVDSDQGVNFTGCHNCIIRFCISQNDCLSTLNSFQGGIVLNTFNVAPCLGAQIYGNTIYGSSVESNAACLQAGAIASMTGNVSNNIFYSGANNIQLVQTAGVTTALLFAGNDYFAVGTFSIVADSTNYVSVAAWQTATSQEKLGGVNVGLTSNPGLTNPGGGGTINAGSFVTPALLAGLTSYKLAHGSAMFGAGLSLGQFGITIPGLDFYSNILSPTNISVGANCPVVTP